MSSSVKKLLTKAGEALDAALNAIIIAKTMTIDPREKEELNILQDELSDIILKFFCVQEDK